MPLSMDNDIVTADIAQIKQLSRKVYRLDGYVNDTVIIKTEAGRVDAEMFNATRRTLKQVDRVGAQARLLQQTERDAVRRRVERMIAYASQFTNNRMAVYAISRGAPDWAADLEGWLRGSGDLWYKMPLQNIADLEQALKNRLQATPDKDLLREFQVALAQPGGLEMLGKIVACDMINGTRDRFYPGQGRGATFAGVSFKFRTLVNVGNVFIVGTGTSRSLTGMDFLDPNGFFREYDKTINELKSIYSETRWSGDYVTRKELRQPFCKDIVWDLNLILSGGDATGTSRMGRKKTWLPIDARERLEKGMVAGAVQVRDGLRRKYATNANKPAGLDSRLAALDALPKTAAVA
jgi:hypothetical protein